MTENGFLKQVATKIFEKEQTNLHDVMILFPNRRAIRFFFEYLKDCAKENNLSSNNNSVFFVPEIFSIDQMVISSMPDIRKGENLELLYILYSVYSQVLSEKYIDNNDTTNNNITIEPFDEFYFWGNTILNDFDQIDKELVDAKALFRNLQDYRDLQADPESYLTEEQIALINRLFNTSIGKDEQSSITKNFVSIWNCLSDIYEKFNQCLDELHIAYSGKMYREFARRLENNKIALSCKKIKVIGFSVLNNVEKKIFRLLRDNFHTDFYWDYDKYYVDDKQNEAGIFIRENINLYPQSEDIKNIKYDNIKENKQEIDIIESPYETTSLAYIPKWLDEVTKETKNNNEGKQDLSNIAIILNDETLIPLVLEIIPKQYKDKINITMGYPFSQTWLYNEVIEKMNALVDSDKFNKENVFEAIKEITKDITQNKKNKDVWQIAILKKVCKSLLSFLTSIENVQNIQKQTNTTSNKDSLRIDGSIIKNIIKKELSSLKMDILSDGIAGVQLMGMLETRTLDFDYILMLSTNDDKLPHLNNESSFIPFSFRKAYKMMDIDRKAGVFAYYFYRLLHHVKRIDYLFVTVGSESKVNEKSRFVRQIEIEFPHFAKNKQINFKSLSTNKGLSKKQTKKYPFDIKQLEYIDEGEKYLSPSSLNNLIDCQQRFYLNNVCYLREEVADDKYLEIAFGNIFHNSINIFYKKVKEINSDRLEEDKVDNLINKSIEEYINDEKNKKEKRVCGDEFHLELIKKYIKRVWNIDRNEKIGYLCGEKEYKVDLEVEGHTVHLGGRLDRMDYVFDGTEEVLRILDYKTGRAKDIRFNEINDLMFAQDTTKARADSGLNYIFEVLFYCYLVYKNGEATKIKPEIMYLSKMQEREMYCGKGSAKKVFYYDENTHREFEKCLIELLKTLINKEKEEYSIYDMEFNDKKCEKCDYRILCYINKEG